MAYSSAAGSQGAVRREPSQWWPGSLLRSLRALFDWIDPDPTESRRPLDGVPAVAFAYEQARGSTVFTVGGANDFQAGGKATVETTIVARTSLPDEFIDLFSCEEDARIELQGTDNLPCDVAQP